MNEALLKISEIFRSIQGESSYAGWPCAFIRLAGCSHNCRYCDSLYARNTEERLTTREVVSRALALKTEIIEITGGEPLEQPGVHQLMTELCNTGRKVLLETGGFIPVAGIDPRVHKIIDLKPPSSGSREKTAWRTLPCLQSGKRAAEIIRVQDGGGRPQRLSLVERPSPHASSSEILHCPYGSGCR